MKKIIAFLLAFLLTGTLVLFCVSFVCCRELAPALSEGGAQVSEQVISREQQMITERVKELSEDYGFSSGPVLDFIKEETVRDLNTQASAWWSNILRKGKAGEELSWDSGDLNLILETDPAIAAMEDREQADYLSVAGADEVRRSVLRTVLPMRQQVVRVGLQKVSNRVDLPGMISFFLGVPWAALAVCALLAGLIVLLESRKDRFALRCIGAALGAAVLVMIAVAAVYLCAGVQGMIREASESLTVLYQYAAGRALVRAGILSAAMAAGCVLCLAGSRRKDRTA